MVTDLHDFCKLLLDLHVGNGASAHILVVFTDYSSSTLR